MKIKWPSCSMAQMLQAAVLDSARKEGEWPPRYPRVGTLLVPSSDPQMPRDQWGGAEWRAYAEFLEEQGTLIATRLLRARSDLRVARNSLRRTKGARTSLATTLLTADATQKGKPGRPRSGRTEKIALEILDLQVELEKARGRKVSAENAMKEYFLRNGQAYNVDHVGALRNAISKARVKFHKNRSR